VEWCWEPGWGVSSGSLNKTLLLSLLVNFTISVIFVLHIHFWPIGASWFVSAQFIFTDSLLAFFLAMVLEFAVVAMFSYMVCVTLRTITISTFALSIWVVVLVFGPYRCFIIVEGCNVVLIPLTVFVLFVNCHDHFGGFGVALPLNHGRNPVHVIHVDSSLVLLCHYIVDSIW